MKDGASMSKTSPLIYVVDDDASVREALSSLIRSAGLRVETFASAQEFLALPKPDVPSCLVLDVQLPGLSGLDLQQELAKADVQIPIIFLTGHGDIPMSVRAMKAGALEFLTKPFNDEDLLEAIQQGIMRDHRARQQRGNIAQHNFERYRGYERRIERCAGTSPGRGADGFHRAHSRRDRHGQGTRCASDPQDQFPVQSCLRQAQLRGDSLGPLGKRAVWS